MSAYWIDRLFFVFLSVFLLITGLAAVTNIEVVWMHVIAGICALAAGVVGLLRAFYVGRGAV